ncbi:MAG: hypothetical protein JRM88_06575 [Nitrososphaerota archaeon]|jgi:hypothetical protein|nr:hypothetical protein [Nitrososphaerota archaeon]
MSLDRPTRTVSVKILAHTAEEAIALVKALDRALPGVKLTSGVRPSERTQSKATRFDYEYYAFALVTFTLSASGEARPTAENAKTAFMEGRRP